MTEQDPREALIVSLRREAHILDQENNHLRKLLDLAVDPSAQSEVVQLSNTLNNGGFISSLLDGRGL